jgi:hypothetical protein
MNDSGGEQNARLWLGDHCCASAIMMLVTAYPVIWWLVYAPSFPRLSMVELWLSFPYATYNGTMVVLLTQIMPAEVRISGFAPGTPGGAL